MITVKANQKLFTYAEVVNLTGICLEHLHNFVKRHRLGFIARVAERAGIQADERLFTPWDLTVLVALFPAVRTDAEIPTFTIASRRDRSRNSGRTRSASLCRPGNRVSIERGES